MESLRGSVRVYFLLSCRSTKTSVFELDGVNSMFEIKHGNPVGVCETTYGRGYFFVTQIKECNLKLKKRIK